MKILTGGGSEKTKPIQSQSKPIRQATRCRCGIAGLIKANFTAPPPCPEGPARKNPTSIKVGLVEIILPILTLRLKTAFE